MNHSEGWGPGDRGGSRGRSTAYGRRANRQKSQSPVTVDKSLNECSGNRGRGFRGRGRGYGYANDGLVYVKKSNPVADLRLEGKGVQQQQRKSPEEEMSATKRLPVVEKLGDNKDLLQSSACSSSDNTSLSGGSLVSRECEDRDKHVKDEDTMLVNEMKDVSLSCQESVSSTNDHKSGDAGNSSNESNKRPPFDIVLETKGFGLKPSLMAVNKAKRKAAKGYTGIFIRPGMVLLKNYLSISDQVMIVKKCRQLGLGEEGFYQPGYRDEAVLHLKMMCLGKNWDPETSLYGETRPVDGSTPPKIPVEFSQLVEKAIEESQPLVATNSKKVKGEDGIPYMSPDICIVNFYTSTGRLGLHQDKDESKDSFQRGLPVVSFSIGDSAEFLYSDQRDEEKAEMVLLESGDVLIFGGKSRSVFHGVRSIKKDTAPKVLVQETSLRPGRLNLTFRQY